MTVIAHNRIFSVGASTFSLQIGCSFTSHDWSAYLALIDCSSSANTQIFRMVRVKFRAHIQYRKTVYRALIFAFLHLT